MIVLNVCNVHIHICANDIGLEQQTAIDMGLGSVCDHTRCLYVMDIFYIKIFL